MLKHTAILLLSLPNLDIASWGTSASHPLWKPLPNVRLCVGVWLVFLPAQVARTRTQWSVSPAIRQ